MKKATHGTGIMLTQDLIDNLRTKVARAVTNRMHYQPKHFIERKLWEVGFALDLIANPLDRELSPFDPFEFGYFR